LRPELAPGKVVLALKENAGRKVFNNLNIIFI
jgi:hypothetical protein